MKTKTKERKRNQLSPEPETPANLEQIYHISVKELEQRKRRIEAELKQIETSASTISDRYRGKVLSFLFPVKSIEKRPLRTVAIAVVTGYLIGSRCSRRSRGSTSASGASLFSLKGLFTQEIKRVAAQRALRFAFDRLEMFADRRAHSHSIRKKLPPHEPK
ncbi:MAG: hypothetical protein WD529_00335 [Balneolaceae bacterium]